MGLMKTSRVGSDWSLDVVGRVDIDVVILQFFAGPSTDYGLRVTRDPE